MLQGLVFAVIAVVVSSFSLAPVSKYPFTELSEFLSEHIQPSDQLLVLGANDLALNLARNGYGRRDTSRSFLYCIDPDPQRVEETLAEARECPVCAQNIEEGFLKIECHDLTNIEVLGQSTVDSILDAGALDQLYQTRGVEAVSAAVDNCHRIVRLGNQYVGISQLEPSVYCGFFDSKFGWMCELDGDPEAMSQWFRQESANKGGFFGFKGLADLKTNKGTAEMAKLGLKFFAYTNTDNC
ncbi:unnamed protein product [Heterosigma akashiwo]